MQTVFIIADDHPMMLSGIREVLRDLEPDALVLEAQSYPEILPLLDQYSSIDLVVADLNMPGMSPMDGIRAIQSSRPDVPLVVMSATETPEAIRRTMEAGVAGYLFKSFDVARLRSALQEVLEGNAFTPDASVSTDPVAAPDPFSMTVTQADFNVAMDHLPVGVLVLDANASVQRKNSTAEDIVSLRDGLDIGKTGILRLNTPDLSRELHRMVTRVAGAGAESLAGQAMSVPRPSMKRSFALQVTPLVEGRVMVFVSDPEQVSIPAVDVLSSLYGLTNTEARVLQSLVAGKKAEDFAEEAGVTMNTVRSHLKQIFRKTGTNRQPELVSMVLSGTSMMGSRVFSG